LGADIFLAIACLLDFLYSSLLTLIVGGSGARFCLDCQRSFAEGDGRVVRFLDGSKAYSDSKADSFREDFGLCMLPMIIEATDL